MRAPRAGRPSLAPHLAAVLLLGVACGWDHLDAFGPAAAAGADGGASASGGASRGAGDDDAASADGSGVGGGGAVAPCGDSQPPLREWSFDAALEGWTLLSDARSRGTLVWTGATGDPAPGALQVDVTPGAGMGAWLAYTTPLGDLTGRVASAWVWLDVGPSPRFKLYVQTGAQYAWADSGVISLPARTWTCVSLPLSAPSYSQASYDPTQVIVMGFEMLSAQPFRVFVDSVRYD